MCQCPLSAPRLSLPPPRSFRDVQTHGREVGSGPLFGTNLATICGSATTVPPASTLSRLRCRGALCPLASFGCLSTIARVRYPLHPPPRESRGSRKPHEPRMFENAAHHPSLQASLHAPQRLDEKGHTPRNCDGQRLFADDRRALPSVVRRLHSSRWRKAHCAVGTRANTWPRAENRLSPACSPGCGRRCFSRLPGTMESSFSNNGKRISGRGPNRRMSAHAGTACPPHE